MQPAKTPEPAKPTHAPGERSERSNAPAVQQPPPAAMARREDSLTVASLFQDRSFKAAIDAALPSHLSGERMLRVALTEARKNPLLMQCDPSSFAGAIVQCSQLGLEPGGVLGHAYLIPFKNWAKSKDLGRDVFDCQLIIGYKGLIELVRRSGDVLSLTTEVVYEKDDFRRTMGTRQEIIHVPANGDRGKPTHVYGVAVLRGGGIQTEVMTLQQIEAIRNREGPGGKKKPRNPVWDTDFAEMCRKTVIRRMAKTLPVSIEVRRDVDRASADELPTQRAAPVDLAALSAAPYYSQDAEEAENEARQETTT